MTAVYSHLEAMNLGSLEGPLGIKDPQSFASLSTPSWRFLFIDDERFVSSQRTRLDDAMYFQQGIAKRLKPSLASAPDDQPPLPNSLASIAKLGGAREETVVDICRDDTGELVAVLGQTTLSVWSVKPHLLLCKIKRTHLSVRRYGINESVHWRPSTTDQAGLVVQTLKSGLLYYALQPMAQNSMAYKMPLRPTSGPTVDFRPGSGEGPEIPAMMLTAESALDLLDEEIAAISGGLNEVLVATVNPPSLLTIPWDVLATLKEGTPKGSLYHLFSPCPMSKLAWLLSPDVLVLKICYCLKFGIYSLLTTCGRVYLARPPNKAINFQDAQPNTEQHPIIWEGDCVYGRSPEQNKPEQSGEEQKAAEHLNEAIQATEMAFNARFSLLSVGLTNGRVCSFNISSSSLRSAFSHVFSLREALKSTASHLATDRVSTLAWTSDGHALTVGWLNGFSIWSAYGRLLFWAVNGDVGSGTNDSEGMEKPLAFEDYHTHGIMRALWVYGDFDLWLLCPTREEPTERAIDEQLFVLNFARSAVTGIHSPDNTNHAFLQAEDRLLVYRGTDQPDMSVINPESDVWQSIKLPGTYCANNWPVTLASISPDGRLIAVAGAYGFCHYNSLSGRWKTFELPQDEQNFTVCGGMQWYENVLLAAVQTADPVAFKLRLFSRDRPLAPYAVLHEETYEAPIVVMSIFESSLLVYTADNTLYHYLIILANGGAQATLKPCGSIGFEGVVRDPSRVRGMSWLVPHPQQRFGDPADDLNVATVIFLIDGKLILLRPRRAAQEEVKYDLQVVADKIEFYWTHLSGIGTLENSLWGYDGHKIRVWLNALTVDSRALSRVVFTGSSRPPSPDSSKSLAAIKESFAISLDFYPLSVLMVKGIIVGADQETTLRRTISFAYAKITTSTHLFLHHVLRFHLSFGQVQEAVLFASCYQHLVYFAHALEILLHDVLETEADALIAAQKSRPPTPTTPTTHGAAEEAPSRLPTPVDAVLPRVIEFLDHFEESLQVVVGCARKTEIERWYYLFDIVGRPRDLFEKCISMGQLKVAASYLLVLHNLESAEKSSEDTVRLLKATMQAQDWTLGKELLRFLYSLDHSGIFLRQALQEADAIPAQSRHLAQRSASAPAPKTERALAERDERSGEGNDGPITNGRTSLWEIGLGLLAGG